MPVEPEQAVWQQFLHNFGKVSGNNVKFNVPGGNLYIDIEEINDVKDSDLCVHGISLQDLQM